MIKRIQIYGERCSGTNYLANLIKINFSNVKVVEDYGWRHFLPKGLNRKDHDDCLFIIIVRNPFDWLRSINKNPWHCHKRLRNISFSKFIRRRWICIFDEEGGVIKGDPKYGSEMLFERNPENGKRFRNVLDMRNNKIKYFLMIENKVKNYYFVNYEELSKNQDILKKIAKEFDIKLKNKKVINITKYKDSNEEYIPKIYENIKKRDLKFIKNKLNWNQERIIGYKFEDYKEKQNIYLTVNKLSSLTSNIPNLTPQSNHP